MATEFSVTHADEPAIQVYAEILSQSLQFPPLREFDWVGRAGPENIRVIRRCGEVIGGLVLLKMGQWFGGRSVPMVGINAVAIAPHERAGGAGTALMQAAVQELHEHGVALSALYPATQPVYRNVGYEQAGVRLRYRLATAVIDTRRRDLPVRLAQPDDREAIRRLYNERARHANGTLDRGEWSWRRIFSPRKGTPYGYVVEEAGAVCAYVFFLHETRRTMHYDLDLLDVAARTREGALRLLTLFADHRSMARFITWHGGSADPLAALLSEQRARPRRSIDWMLRIVDLRAALESRGYPAGLRAELHLDVHDDVLPANAGKWHMQVADGQATVRAGGSGGLRADIRGLAALFTGHRTAHDLKLIGQLEGDDETLATATAVFAGPAPWMSDMF